LVWLVYLVYVVYLVYFVDLVCFVYLVVWSDSPVASSASSVSTRQSTVLAAER